jgi:hypothetical protein
MRFRSLLFFSMLLSLGLGSQIGILEGMIGPLFDIPSLKNVKKPVITGKHRLLAFQPGLPDFSLYNIPKRGVNKPNDHKMDQINIKCTNWHIK